MEGALTDLAEATLEAAVDVLGPSLPFAVIALGRLGGAELSYASDLDVVFVYDGSTPDDFAAAERVATTLLSSVGGNSSHTSTTSTPICVPRARTVRWLGASTATASTSTDGHSRGSDWR